MNVTTLHPAGGGGVLSITSSDIITPCPQCGQTNASENMTLPQTSFAGGNDIKDIIHNINDIASIVVLPLFP